MESGFDLPRSGLLEHRSSADREDHAPAETGLSFIR
jgi:hypothetical protein